MVTPLSDAKRDVVTWAQAKTFARQICSEMANDSPDRYLINMSKQQRKGKIFLDYLRNDTKSTAVALLSPRARPGATVSMPMSWAQVKAGLDPAKFTIRTVPGLMKRSKAWAGLRRGRRLAEGRHRQARKIAQIRAFRRPVRGFRPGS